MLLDWHREKANNNTDHFHLLLFSNSYNVVVHSGDHKNNQGTGWTGQKNSTTCLIILVCHGT